MFITIRCGDCAHQHPSTVLICPVCGRCPRCADRRLDRRLKKDRAFCRSCACSKLPGDEQCSYCGAVDRLAIGLCVCGHPDVPRGREETERAFRVM